MAKKVLDPATPHRDAQRVTSAVGDCDAFFAVIYIYMYIRLYTFQAALRVDFVWKTLELGHRTLVASAFILQYGSHSGFITSLLYTGARGNLEAMSNEGPVNRLATRTLPNEISRCPSYNLQNPRGSCAHGSAWLCIRTHKPFYPCPLLTGGWVYMEGVSDILSSIY